MDRIAFSHRENNQTLVKGVIIAVVLHILTPFSDVAQQVLQAPRIWTQLGDLVCLSTRVGDVPCDLLQLFLRRWFAGLFHLAAVLHRMTAFSNSCLISQRFDPSSITE